MSKVSPADVAAAYALCQLDARAFLARVQVLHAMLPPLMSPEDTAGLGELVAALQSKVVEEATTTASLHAMQQRAEVMRRLREGE